MPADMRKMTGMAKARFLNSQKRVDRGYGEEHGADGKRRRRTNSRRGFLSKMADGYRGN